VGAGPMVKLQCDFSAMIGPDTFAEFMAPVLAEMTERISYSMYHWTAGRYRASRRPVVDPAADMIQWTPGAGMPPPDDACWWPLYIGFWMGQEGVHDRMPVD